MSPRVETFVMHAAFDEKRHASLLNLLERAPTVNVVRDHNRRGAWQVARDCWRIGLATTATYIAVLNDDALPCLHFEQVLNHALATGDKDIVCLYTAHDKAKLVLNDGMHWYCTVDGLVGVGCVMKREIIHEFLTWTEWALNGAPITDDGRINLFAMCTGRRIYTTVPSLVDHQLPNESLVGNADHDHRRPSVPPTEDMRDIDWETPAANLGRQYRGNHWQLLTHLTPQAKRNFDAIARAYRIERETV